MSSERHTTQGIIIKLLSDVKDWKLLTKAWLDFVRLESAGSAVAAFQTVEGQQKQTEVLRLCVESNEYPIIIAWDPRTQKVAGFILHQIQEEGITLTHSSINHLSQSWCEEDRQDIDKLVSFYTNQAKCSDFFNKYELDKLWKMLIVAVDEDYSRQGIGGAMMSHSLELARENDIKLCVSNFSSLYTQRIGRRLGFETVYEAIYKDKYELYDNMPENIRQTHLSCIAMALKL